MTACRPSISIGIASSGFTNKVWTRLVTTVTFVSEMIRLASTLNWVVAPRFSLHFLCTGTGLLDVAIPFAKQMATAVCIQYERFSLSVVPLSCCAVRALLGHGEILRIRANRIAFQAQLGAFCTSPFVGDGSRADYKPLLTLYVPIVIMTGI